MKKFIISACLTVLMVLALSACGTLSPDYFNEKAKIDIATSQYGLESYKSHDKVSIQLQNEYLRDMRLNYQVKKQSHEIQEKAYNEVTPNAGMVDGILVNGSKEHFIRWVVLRGPDDPRPPIDAIIGPKQIVPAELPIGQYIAQCYRFTLKGEVLDITRKLDVTNERIPSYLGVKYFFTLVRQNY